MGMVLTYGLLMRNERSFVENIFFLNTYCTRIPLFSEVLFDYWSCPKKKVSYRATVSTTVYGTESYTLDYVSFDILIGTSKTGTFPI